MDDSCGLEKPTAVPRNEKQRDTDRAGTSYTWPLTPREQMYPANGRPGGWARSRRHGNSCQKHRVHGRLSWQRSGVRHHVSVGVSVPYFLAFPHIQLRCGVKEAQGGFGIKNKSTALLDSTCSSQVHFSGVFFLFCCCFFLFCSSSHRHTLASKVIKNKSKQHTL